MFRFLKISLAAFGFYLFLGSLAPVFSADASLDSLSDRVQRLESSLTLIQKQQGQILEKQKELSEKLDTVKVWARRG